jgi:aspartyl-tRNA(Asn)/glutamyl-tRNA(Gln) amidotransferase subunit A
MADDPHLLSATDLVDGYRAGALSPVDAVAACVGRIAALDGTLNGFCLVSETALDEARAAEARWRAGTPLGPLDGVPTSIKDILLTRGWPTLRGSRTVDPAGPWDDDAPAVARLREAGAVLVGKTTTPEFGWKGMTDSPLTGITRNPWDPSRTAGGSSGGAAVAAACGMAALNVGTDGGGSIRMPAGFSGIVGLKPTFGVVPAWPLSVFGTVAHLGPMTRTVADAALMLDVMAAPDHRDWHAMPVRIAASDGLEDGVRGLRIAYSATLGYAEVDPEVAALVARAAAAFEALGAHVEAVDPGFDDPDETFRRHWFPSAAYAVAQVPEERRAAMDSGLLEISRQGTAMTLQEHLAAVQARGALGLLMHRFHETYDLLLTPTLPIPAFAADPAERPAGFPTDADWPRWTPFTYPFNLTQQPAASVPCGLTASGLPVGLQIVGAKFTDALVLRAARAYEQAHPAPLPALAG